MRNQPEADWYRAMYMYFSDYEDRFPPSRAESLINTCGHVAYYLQDYIPLTKIDKAGVWKCPSYPPALIKRSDGAGLGGFWGIYNTKMMPGNAAAPAGGCWATYQMTLGWAPGYTNGGGDYWRDGWGLACNRYTTTAAGWSWPTGSETLLGATRKLSEIKNTSAMCMLYEVGSNYYPFFEGASDTLGNTYSGSYGGATSAYNGDSMCLWTDGRYPALHSGGNNYLFVDGHVEWRKFAQLTPDMWKVNY